MTDTLTRAVEIHGHQRLCGHEAAHAAAAMLLGLEVVETWADFHTLAELEHANPDDPAGASLLADPDPRCAAIATLAGPLEDGRPDWPPRWPLSLAPTSPDEAQLATFVKRAGLDQDGYRVLVRDALELTASRDFERLAVAIGHALETQGRLDRRELKQIKTITEGADVDHLLVKATTTARDQGTFEAVVSTATIDREKDVVDPDAMVRALQKWTATEKLIPLAWNHSTAADHQIGHVDPASARQVDGEVVIKGWVDQSTKVGDETWRLVKAGTLGFSFGYLILASTERQGGGRHITDLDVFEITATTIPSNGDTRVIGWKALDDPQFVAVRDQWRGHILDLLGSEPSQPQRDKAQLVARKHAPIQTQTFEC